MFRDGEPKSPVGNEPFLYAVTPEHIKENDVAIERFLYDEGADIALVTSLPAEQRSDYLIDCLLGDNRASVPMEAGEAPQDDEIGMIVVKPEIFPYSSDVVDFLGMHGIEARSMERLHPSREAWLNTYGYMLEKHPDVIHLYVTHRALGLQPVVFRHLTLEEYEQIDALATEAGMGDRDKIFDTIFCGEVNQKSGSTLRGAIARHAMRILGFDTMTFYASSFDPVGYFKDNTHKIYRAFNGVHVPSDREEKQKNMKDFIREVQ